ncbi:hypothetical protein [Ureibacillus massiliensis]|uniref:hypothetical protein n=1 Tax=Ureibacillus massiliensis TaxID=292806 RepID=UPI00068D1C7F|nr:hypothetical protein [Ureibacillus massiliensis]
MKKIVYIVLLIAIVIIVAELFWNRASLDTNLSKEIQSLIEQGEKKIDLTKLTDFEWGAAEVFGPYSTNEAIEESMGIRFKGDNGGIDILDDRILIVFANEKNAVKTVVLKHFGVTIRDNKLLVVE